MSVNCIITIHQFDYLHAKKYKKSAWGEFILMQQWNRECQRFIGLGIRERKREKDSSVYELKV
jgi:hypothetical protein